VLLAFADGDDVILVLSELIWVRSKAESESEDTGGYELDGALFRL